MEMAFDMNRLIKSNLDRQTIADYIQSYNMPMSSDADEIGMEIGADAKTWGNVVYHRDPFLETDAFDEMSNFPNGQFDITCNRTDPFSDSDDSDVAFIFQTLDCESKSSNLLTKGIPSIFEEQKTLPRGSCLTSKQVHSNPFLETLNAPLNLQQVFNATLRPKAHVDIQKVKTAVQKNEFALNNSSIAESLKQAVPFMNFKGQLYIFDKIWVVVGKQFMFYCRLFLTDEVGLTPYLQKRDFKEIEEHLSSDPQLFRSKSDLLPCTGLISCTDGFYDIYSAEIKKQTPEFGVFSYVNISAYEIGNGKGFFFETFVRNASNGDFMLRKRILEMIAIVVLCSNNKSFFYVYGKGDTGKSQLTIFLQELVGEDCSLSIRDINALSDNWTVGSLQGKKLCTCMDIPDEIIPPRTIAELKKLVGDNFVGGNIKYRDPVTFSNEAVMVFAGNKPMKILHPEQEQPFLNRMVPIPLFNPVAKEDQIPKLSEKMLNEAGYIVGEAIKAYLEFEERGHIFTEVELPEYIENYSDSSETVTMFIDQCCSFEIGIETTTASLYETFIDYCRKNGNQVLSKIDFSRKISKLLVNLDPYRDPAGNRGYRGIALKD